MAAPEPSPVRRALRAWYRQRRARYPWRTERPDPYAVLVSEVMLQQTQAARVAPAFEAFLAAFPDVWALAAATRADTIRAWAGLGYHRRAVALHQAARLIVDEHGGRVPSDPALLRTLPGIGPYTASAVASIAYGRRVVAIDVNVRRVVSRVMLGPEGSPAADADIADAALTLLDRRDPGAWNQAVMDLGREVCRPAPRCDECPLARWCPSRGAGRRARPVRRQPPFVGSSRQLRGRIVAVLRERPSVGIGGLVAVTGSSEDAMRSAVDGLLLEGIVERRGRSLRLPG